MTNPAAKAGGKPRPHKAGGKPRPHKGRAFTLLELTAGMAMGLAIVAVAIGLTMGALTQVRRSRALAQLHRDGTFAARVLDMDLRMAGLGVPTGPHIVTGARMAPVIVARPDALGIVGDLARPDAQYNTFGPLDSRPTRSHDTARAIRGDSVAWHTENNGSCMPGAPDDPCDPNATSVFFPSSAGGGNCTVDANDRVCPWGTRRVRPQDELQIVAADRTWATSRAAGAQSLLLFGGLAADPIAGVLSAPVSLRLEDKLEPGRVFHPIFRADLNDDLLWRNQEPGTLPGGSVGQGFVTSLDRVFFFLQGSTLVRRQCWGRPRPTSPDWPVGNAIPADPAGIADNVCTPPEVIARDVEGVGFRYFDAGTAEITDADPRLRVRRVDFEVRFSRTVTGTSLGTRYVVQGSVALQNS